MNHHFKFGNISVNCEGYDYPTDPYILKGSCGLSYTLDWAGQSEWSTGTKLFLFGFVALVIIFIVFAIACGDPKSNRVSRPGDRSVLTSSRSGSTGSRSTSGFGGTDRR
ncbi:unnamed protein product [Orchesella dallaii]|uniref:Store-operated calcium entry-associated regulatory factor n=1 Tax=Orchesella dallaii TaxID=48710 RepID=A0ABP1RPE7_9HEXA